MTSVTTDSSPVTIRVGQTSGGGPPEHAADISVTLPLEEVLVGRSLICGKSGSGKSNTGGRVAEEILDAGRPLLIVDIEGEYYGLKEEYQILHAGADEACDIQVGPEHGERLAQLGIEQGVPIILDLSGFLDESEADELVGAVARALFATAKQERESFPVFVEECHEFLPQSGSAGETAEAVVRIAKRGRKHGLGLVGISQRPARWSRKVTGRCVSHRRPACLPSGWHPRWGNRTYPP
jgi:DNA helicase HerA-like ATPase